MQSEVGRVTLPRSTLPLSLPKLLWLGAWNQQEPMICICCLALLLHTSHTRTSNREGEAQTSKKNLDTTWLTKNQQKKDKVKAIKASSILRISPEWQLVPTTRGPLLQPPGEGFTQILFLHTPKNLFTVRLPWRKSSLFSPLKSSKIRKWKFQSISEQIRLWGWSCNMLEWTRAH